MNELCKRKPLSDALSEFKATLICPFQLDEYGSGLGVCVQLEYQSIMKTLVAYALASLPTRSSVVRLAQTRLARSLHTAWYREVRETCIAAGALNWAKSRASLPSQRSEYQSSTS